MKNKKSNFTGKVFLFWIILLVGYVIAMLIINILSFHYNYIKVFYLLSVIFIITLIPILFLFKYKISKNIKNNYIKIDNHNYSYKDYDNLYKKLVKQRIKLLWPILILLPLITFIVLYFNLSMYIVFLTIILIILISIFVNKHIMKKIS